VSVGLYYVQPDGAWKKNGDGRSRGLDLVDLPDDAEIYGEKTMIEQAKLTSLLQVEVAASQVLGRLDAQRETGVHQSSPGLEVR